LASSSYVPPLTGCDGLAALDGYEVGLLRDPPLFDIVIGDQGVEREPQLAAKAPQGFCPAAAEFPERGDFHRKGLGMRRKIKLEPARQVLAFKVQPFVPVDQRVGLSPIKEGQIRIEPVYPITAIFGSPGE